MASATCVGTGFFHSQLHFTPRCKSNADCVRYTVGRSHHLHFRKATRRAALPQSPSSDSLFAKDENYILEKEELNEDTDSFAYLVNTVQCILHFKYPVGQYLDEYDTRLIQEEVLRFHPRASEKIGCGIGTIMVSYHPEHIRSRCFMIHRLDDSLCDFSYRKSMLERARLKGINMVIARRLLNMDYFNLSQSPVLG